MAYYKIGDRLLSQEEYDEDSLQKWGFALFVIGAFLTGTAIMTWLPAEWPKYIRFPIVVIMGCAVGIVAAYFARFIRQLTGWSVLLAIFVGIGYGIWTLL